MEPSTKSRKELPSFGYLNRKPIDIDMLTQHCREHGLLDFSRYNDIQVSSGSNISDFVRVNRFNKNSFFKESDAPSLEGTSYRQIYLTELNPKINRGSININALNSPGRRLARLDPKSKDYDPVADELNYNHRNHLVTGIFAEILDSFRASVKRVRLAYVAPHFSIKPHVDYDPSYIARYHIPIVTNKKCVMHTIRNSQIEYCHFPADGRIYFFNAGLKHWASNDSDEARLHLIIDTHGQEDLESLVEIPSQLTQMP